MPPTSVPRPLLAALLVVFAFVWFANLEVRSLIRPDEGRYAEIAREMALSGDFVTPRLNGLVYFEKPPLQYWATAIAFRTLGVAHWTARWWPATTAFVLVVAIWLCLRRPWGEGPALDAAVALAAMLWFVVNAHLNTLDTGLAAFLSLALLALIVAESRHDDGRRYRRWMCFAWAALALAVLSKGVVALVLPGLAITAYAIIERDWRLPLRVLSLPAIGLFAMIAVPWFVVIGMREPGFLHFFFIHEHFDRFLTTSHRRVEPWWYFGPLLLVGALPWTFLLIGGLRAVCTGETTTPGFRPARFALVFALVVTGFFSLSGSKLPSYILPAFPALALVVARIVGILPARRLAWLAAPAVAVALALAGVLVFRTDALVAAFESESTPAALLRGYLPWLLGASTALGIGAGIASVAFWHNRRRFAIIAMGLGGLVSAQLALTGHDELAPLSSANALVFEIEQRHGPFDPDLPFYSVKTYDQTLPFYLRRTVTLVDYVDEFATGIDREPAKAVPTLARWRDQWSVLAQGYAYLQPDLHAELERAGVPMRVLGRDPRRVVVSRR